MNETDPRKHLEGVRSLARLARELKLEKREQIVKQLGRVAEDHEPFVR